MAGGVELAGVGVELIPEPGSGTVTSVSVVTANGVSGSVATATTTPAITLTLGAITPTSVAIGGAAIGSNALAVTGTAAVSGQLSIGAAGATAAILGGTVTPLTTYSGSTATPRLQIQGLNSPNSGAAFSTWANSTGGSAIWMTSSRGTTVGDYTIAQAGDGMGAIIFEAADGTDFTRAASILARVTGTPGANVMPGQLEFSTTPSGSGTPVLALTVNSAGSTIVASGKQLQLGNAAVTGLVAGALAALTTASITITDSTGTVYRIPCII